ncbi:MAG TPA: HD domain-containing phosphohydrolase [Gemmatimonadales bacterium]|jgi:putative two-component system response regulator|nr:HD domain-containing phosphohydrolase [Gemmatimonadales bacterium]
MLINMTLYDPTQARILIVDDEEKNVNVLGRMLASAGYGTIRGCTDSTQAISTVQEFSPDLILLDLTMPSLDGFEVMEALNALLPPDSYLPILILTGDIRFEARQRALSSGAKDFLLKPFDMTEVLLRIRNLLETRFLYLLHKDQNQMLEIRVAARTGELEEARVEILQRLSYAAEFRDDDTGQHTKRVASLAMALGASLGLDRERLELIHLTAQLHDVGKIGIPDAVLLKPGKLTAGEFEIMKTHTSIGARIFAGGKSPLVRMAEAIALNHHERWNGTGYPNGLKGEAIPLEARLVSVADVYDALSHPRPYRGAWSPADTRKEIEQGAGGHFDPELVEIFLKLPADAFPR